MSRENAELPPKFLPTDLKAPARFAENLLDPQSLPLFAFLNKQLTSQERDNLARWAGDPAKIPSLAELLVQLLNRVAAKGALYEKDCFDDIPLSPESKLLQQQKPSGDELFRINRQLLEDAFPDDVQHSFAPPSRKPIILPLGPAEEPWVTFTTEDHVGLALSGGGIRSATFNLGLLQALAQNQVLERLHYVSTVSGGGYIGGFWTRWRQQQLSLDASIAGQTKGFPEAAGGAGDDNTQGPSETREPAEFRHLREFSRFLIPRKGLNAEFWSAGITILSGLVPSLIAALAAVLLTTTVWALLADWLAWGDWSWTGFAYTTLVALMLCLGEFFPRLRRYRQNQKCKYDDGSGATALACGVWSLLALALCFVGWWYWRCGPLRTGAESHLGEYLKIDRWNEHYRSWFGPSISLFAVLAVLTVTRLIWGRIGQLCICIVVPTSVKLRKLRQWLFSRKDQTNPATETPKAIGSGPHKRNLLVAWSSSLDRVMGQLLALQVIWTALAGIFALAQWLVSHPACHVDGPMGKLGSTGGLSGVTAVLALLFYWVRNWLKKPKEEGSDSKLQALLKPLKPMVPQLLANGIVVLLFVLAAAFLPSGDLWTDYVPTVWIQFEIAAYCLAILALVLLLFDPATVGLHQFYRARLSRCYLGASLASSPPNRDWAEHPDEDMRLKDACGLPIHLVCCAANQFWGDPLSTLHRGARSVVLSRFGIALGDHYVDDEDLRLSSALTASAAAFNSMMGDLNVTLGRAVPFVMTALNLRLGLWVKNPASQRRRSWKYRWFPGLFFVNEMLGIAQCSTDGQDAKSYMHLSDGGHFENLALYELIRRHCRYIFVSDAGEDKEFAFTDFGRAARRVREDFGVEIEINLAPLRPGADGLSQQHVAVGVIHYDGVVGTDKGTLVYLKPALTADEPLDVLQYRKRKPDFPHEPTGDQFFDEAQFESYRRLGEHTGNASLRILKARHGKGESAHDNEALFHDLRLYWQRVPWLHCDDGIRLCEHASDLEDALRDQASTTVRQEFMGDLIAAIPNQQTPGSTTTTAAGTTQTAGDLLLAIKAFKFLEEAWVICELDDYWSNPRAQSWMSYLHRWAAMPSLQKWWPALKSFYGRDFVAFANAQLNLASVDVESSGKTGSHATLELTPSPTVHPALLQPSFAKRLKSCQLELYKRLENPGLGLKRFDLKLSLLENDGSICLSVQVGLAAIVVDSKTARWQIDDLFVPPDLHGGGFNTSLLDKLIEHFESNLSDGRVTQLQVDLPKANREPEDKAKNNMQEGKVEQGTRDTIETRQKRGRAERQKQIELVDFYRNRGFKFDGETWNNGQNTRMVLVLPRSPANQAAS
jgi:hypothetical protein